MTKIQKIFFKSRTKKQVFKMENQNFILKIIGGSNICTYILIKIEKTDTFH